MPTQDKSKIEISAPKIPILFMSDWPDTGFGTVGKELCARLAEMEVFDVHYLGWHSNPNDVAEAHHNGIKLHNTRWWVGLEDQFGQQTFDVVVKHVKPKVVITLGDPWMIEHVPNCPDRDTFQWVLYVPIDRDYISQSWRKVMRKPEVLVVYSEFGKDVIEEQMPFRHPELILHGIDRMTFKPVYPPGMNENTDIDEVMAARKKHTMGAAFEDKWVVGFVGRNQIRKAIPRAFRAFKAFNCATWCERKTVEPIDPDTGQPGEKYSADEFCNNIQNFRCDHCPAFSQRVETQHTILYMHSTRGGGPDRDEQDKPGIGWYLDELAKRYGIDGRLAMTPSYTAMKGIPRSALAQLMNCFDVHLFMSHSEGFGLPIVETLACGVPTLVTNYSSMPELVADGGGDTIQVKDYDTYTMFENDWANADIGDAADKVNELFTDKELYTQTRKDAVANQYTPNWDQVAMQFRDLILKCANA